MIPVSPDGEVLPSEEDPLEDDNEAAFAADQRAILAERAKRAQERAAITKREQLIAAAKLIGRANQANGAYCLHEAAPGSPRSVLANRRYYNPEHAESMLAAKAQAAVTVACGKCALRETCSLVGPASNKGSLIEQLRDNGAARRRFAARMEAANDRNASDVLSCEDALKPGRIPRAI